MIQLNLLPDVKQQFIKTRRLKRTISLISMLAVAGALLICGFFLFTTSVIQNRRINTLDEQINKSLASIREKDDLSKILTIQNQLQSLNSVTNDEGTVISPGLHDSKTAANRIFEYMQGVVPIDTVITDLTVDFNEETITIVGATLDYEHINKFVDTLIFTNYIIGTDPDTKDIAFSSVVLTDTNKEEFTVSYTIDAKFDPILFDNRVVQISLDVPVITSTRSAIESPGSLINNRNTGQ